VKRYLSLLVLLLLPLIGWPGRAAADREDPDLTDLTLEELMNIDITSVSKKSEKMCNAAAAVFVITREDLRRMGVTSIPEALRMAPGIQVAQIDANKWAVSARGFNDWFANKLLVMIDGRSVYTPLWSGVLWECQNIPIEDVERIEIIRGPGATMWGANAVNGVINIITRHTLKTQGGQLSLGGGSEQRGYGTLHYSGTLSEETSYRLFTRYHNQDSYVHPDGARATDDWNVLLGGFRLDWTPSTENKLTLQGDYQELDAGGSYDLITSFTPPHHEQLNSRAKDSGWNILGRWEHFFSSESDATVQLYFDRTVAGDVMYGETRSTFDLEMHHRRGLGARHEFMWGVGYRGMMDEARASFSISMNPTTITSHLFNLFIQDDIKIVADRLKMTIGSKFEKDDYSDFEILPNLRLLWTPSPRQTIWTAASRAVRTPSRSERDIRIIQEIFPPDGLYPGAPMTAVAITGSRRFKTEGLLAFELGYRHHPTSRLFLDIATFYNLYDNLRTIEPRDPFLETSPSPPHLVLPLIAANLMKGETYGAEIVADIQASQAWRLRGTYSYLYINLKLDETSGDTEAKNIEGENPRHQYGLQSMVDLPGNLEMDLGVRFVDELPAINIAGYTELDARLGWNPVEQLRFSIVGQNLLHSQHREFTSKYVNALPSEVERSVHLAVLLQF
jgi:iron complex outermembrane receptor protein